MVICRVRREASTFERYQHNRDLVALLNIFADKDADLPPGWEAKLDRNGKVRFPSLSIFYFKDKVWLKWLQL